MSYWGDYKEDATSLVMTFPTRTTTGVPTQLAGSPVIGVYKGISDEPRTSAEADITLTVDFDGITGLNQIAIDLSANAFFAAGYDYSCVITTGTVGGVSVVGEVPCAFSIENRFDEADLVKIHGTVLTETNGQLAGRFINFFDQDSAAFNVKTALADFKATSVTVSDKTGFSLVSTGLDAVTAWTVAITGNITGNLSGTVAKSPATLDWSADVTNKPTIGTSTLTQTQVTGGAYDMTNASCVVHASGNWNTVTPDAAGVVATALGLLETHGDSAWATATSVTVSDKTGFSLANGSIVAATFAAGAITAAAIADAAIDNATFAADVGSTVYATNIIALATRKALDDYDPPTNTEFGLRSLPSADYFVVGDYTVPLDAAGVRAAVGLASANLDTQLADLPTVAEFEARSLVAADYFVVSDYTAPLDAAGIRAAVGMASANLDTQLADLPTVAEFEARSLVSADYFVVGDYTAPLNAAGVRTAVGLASANMDTQLTAIAGYIDTEVGAIYTRLGAPAGVSMSADIAATKADTAAVLVDTGSAGVLVSSGTGTGQISLSSGLVSMTDIYHADIEATVDETNSQDEFTVTWFKNGARVTSGITSPTIQVVKRADGADLVASQTMTQIGSTASYKYDEDTNRMTAGEAVLVIAGATIDGSARSFSRVITRDSSA